MMLGTQGTGTTETAATEVATEVTPAEGASPPPAEDVPKGLDALAGKKPQTGLAPAISAYQANYKFKVLDKEHEIDEFLRGSIKDADTEKKVRDLCERAYGLDSIKSSRDQIRQELAQTKDKIGQTDKALEALGNYVRQGDFDSFFDSLKIPKQNILQYALALVQREQWSPEQKAQYDSHRQASQQAQYYQNQFEQLSQSNQQLQVNQRMFELQTVTSRPDIAPVVQAYEAGIGSPGAFREYAIRIGQAYAAQGQDISAEQAVMEAVKHLRAVSPQLGITEAPQSLGNSQVVAPNQKPVIPNIQGRGASPVKSTVKSIDDLKKRARELEVQGL